MENLTEREAQFLAAVKTELANEVKSLKDNGLTMEQIQAAIDARHQEATKGLATEVALKALEDAVADAVMDIKAMKEDVPGKTPKIRLKDHLIEATKGMSKNDLKRGVNLELKEVGTIAYPSNAYVAFPTMDTDGWGKIPNNVPVIRQVADVKTIATARATWVEMGAKEGSVVVTAPGVTKPQLDMTPVVQTADADKYPGYMKFPEELLDDIYGFMSEVETELVEQVNVAEDLGFIAYLETKAQAYDLTGIKTTSPTKYEAILALVTKVKKNKFRPNAILLNPEDFCNIQFDAFNNGYAINGFINSTGPTIGGVPVIESPEITVGEVYVGDFSRFHVRDFKGMSIRVGLEGSDLKDNTITVVAEKRTVCYIKGGEEGAFVWDAISDAVTAITT